MAKLHSTRTTHQLAYRAIRIEGGLIPADELTRLTLLADPKGSEQTEGQYRIARGLKLRDEIARDFKIALNLWQDFRALRQRQDVLAHDVTVREWLLPLLRDVLHFHDAARCAAIEHAGHQYAIGHAGLFSQVVGGQMHGRVPLVFAGFDQPMDAGTERFGETNPDTGKTRRRSPFMLAQEALNASDASLWAIVSNGLTLRILRDNPSLTRPAYIEVDLEALFTEELLADFSAFWLLAHASRFAGTVGSSEAPPTDCPWERWRAAGQQAGVTVRGKLRYQVAEALRALGTGFLSHPANAALRAALQSADSGYDRQAFFEELLRLVYRFIFLATVEDRRDRATGEHLVFTPEATADAKARYLAGYSLTWLRERAVRRSQHDRHADLWQALTITFGALARGEPSLGLPALGGLFDVDQCPFLDTAQLDNRHLLAAVFQLGWFRADGGLSRVNYRDMGPEELGSVYESLLELVPDLQGLSLPAGSRLAFVGDDETDASTKGNTRKLTGSYYTPDSLVQELIKSALEPVITQTVKANPQRPVEALLALTVCDPACGSGHFLLSAARRLADEVALHRAASEREGGAPTPSDYRHALRDVVSRCIYGVDKNPMAIQLAKTALWLEAYSPDRPLSFVDHHLRVGDALLGVLDPAVLESGIPDEAYTALSGDDKHMAAALKKQNKVDLESWRAISGGDLLTQATTAHNALQVERLDDETSEHLMAKRAAFIAAKHEAELTPLARLADTYVAAFLARKAVGEEERVPLSGYLWGLMTAQQDQSRHSGLEDAARALCRAHGVFHWWLSFPQVAQRGGFDVMLGNPPWERIKLQEEEFFATRSQLVANARHKAERAQRIEWLAEGTLLHRLDPERERAHGVTPPNRAEQQLYQDFILARRGTEAVSLFTRSGRRYPLTGIGDVNTYAMFAESILQATAPHGRAGFIVPTGIATDDNTKLYFGHLVRTSRLVSLFSFYEVRRWFTATDDRKPFCLLTIGSAEQATFSYDIDNWRSFEQQEKRYHLTGGEFKALNPNTLTLPVFRSQRDAELVKKLYRAAPVLVEEMPQDAEGRALPPDNRWGIRFLRMFDMSGDSELFRDSATPAGRWAALPLYEAKMAHQFDHRWGSYASVLPGEEPEPEEVTPEQKSDPNFGVRPRYWLDERHVLARIARVPDRVRKQWWIRHFESDPIKLGAAPDKLRLALMNWLVGELFLRELATEALDTLTPQQAHRVVAAVEERLETSHRTVWRLMREQGWTTRKGLKEMPTWGKDAGDARLVDGDLMALESALTSSDEEVMSLLDELLEQRSPKWHIGWRDVCRSTDYRTLIASVVPNVGVGHKFLLMRSKAPAPHQAALLGNLDSLVLDFIARQKLGGTSFNYFTMRQLAVLSPEQYSAADLDYIVPRVLELTYTTHDMRPWAEDLGYTGAPFEWSPLRRAQLRAELDTYYARLYGLTKEEFEYILDPAEVMGADYPTETFRVLKRNEVREFGEYRTRRLVLEAWDQQDSMSPATQPAQVSYSEHGMIRNDEEGRLAGLVTALVAERAEGSSLVEIQSVVAALVTATHHLGPVDGLRFDALRGSLGIADVASLLSRILPIVQRLTSVNVLVRSTRGGEPIFVGSSGTPPDDVVQLPEHPEVAQLLWLAERRRMESEEAKSVTALSSLKASGTH